METHQIDSFQTVAINPRNRNGLFFWILLLVIGAILMLIYPVMRLGYVYQINYNEGSNVYHASEIAEGQPLYADSSSDPFTPPAYPPLSYFLVGLSGKNFGSYLLAGRVISLVSLLVIIFACSLLLIHQGINRGPAIFGGVSALLLYLGYAQDYIGMDDPHFLALLFAVTGLIIYLRNSTSWPPLMISALLMVLSLYTVQSLFALPLAIGLDVMIRSRKYGIIWVLALLLFWFLLDAFSDFHFGAQFRQQFHSLSHVAPDRVLSQLSRLDIPFFILLLTAGWTSMFCVFDTQLRVFGLYMAISMVIALAFSGSTISSISYFFDLFLALAFLLSVCLLKVQFAFPKSVGIRKTMLWLLPVIITFSLLYHLPIHLPRSNSTDLLASVQKGFRDDADYLKNQQGRIFCENLLLCYTAGKPLEIDPYQASELALLGETDENLILMMIETHQFSVIQLNHALPKSTGTLEYSQEKDRTGSMTRNMRIAIANNYKIDRRSGSGVFYSPR